MKLRQLHEYDFLLNGLPERILAMRFGHHPWLLAFRSGRPVSTDDLDPEQRINGRFRLNDGKEFERLSIPLWSDNNDACKAAATLCDSYGKSGLPYPKLLVIRCKINYVDVFEIDWEGQ